MRAGFLFKEVRIGLRRNLTMTFAVVVTVAISLSLLGIGLLSNAQVNATSRWPGASEPCTVQVLDVPVTEEQLHAATPARIAARRTWAKRRRAQKDSRC